MLLFDEVRFQDAELSRICKSDYRIRIYRAHVSSGQGKLKGLILSKTPAGLRKSSSALHVKMVGRLHDGQKSIPFPG